MQICIGCGNEIGQTPALDGCFRNGDCEIKDFAGVNRLKQAMIDGMLYLNDLITDEEDPAPEPSKLVLA